MDNRWDLRSEIVVSLNEGVYIAGHCLLVFFVQLNFQSFTSNLEAVHLLDCFLGRFGVIEADKSDSFGFSILLSHYPCRVDISESSEEIVELRIFHIVWQVE